MMTFITNKRLVLYLTIISITIFGIILAVFFVSTYVSAKDSAQKTINKKVAEIAEEYRISHLNFSGIPINSSYSQKDLLPDPNNPIKIQRNGKRYQLHDSINTKESLVQICNRMDYTFIFQNKPINKDTLISIQTNLLSKIGFRGKNAMLVTTENQKRWFASDPDSSFITHAIVSAPIRRGLSDEIQFQLYVDASVKEILAFTGSFESLIISIAIFFCIVLFSFSYLYTISRKPDILEDYEISFRYGSLAGSDKSECIFVKGEQLDITGQLYNLLKMLIKNKDHFVSYNDINNTFWSEKTNNTQKRYELISKLRILLAKNDPHFFIYTDIELHGYKLIYDPKMKHQLRTANPTEKAKPALPKPSGKKKEPNDTGS